MLFRSVEKSENLLPFQFDATDCPDLFPSLVVLASRIIGTSVIKGVSRLHNKESDRSNALLQEFSKLGCKIDIVDDDMIIYGGCQFRSGVVHSHHDHRIAMALAIAGMSAKEIVIEHSDSVAKSFPDFFKILKEAGGNVSLMN